MTDQYQPLFYLFVPGNGGTFQLIPTLEIEEPEMAEGFIPYEGKDSRYGITCYFMHLPNSAPAIMELMALQRYFIENGLPATKSILWFIDSPDSGLPSCVCSICQKVIEDSETELPIRLYDSRNDLEARFHLQCFNEYMKGSKDITNEG